MSEIKIKIIKKIPTATIEEDNNITIISLNEDENIVIDQMLNEGENQTIVINKDLILDAIFDLENKKEQAL